MNYRHKYLKYKYKYLQLKNLTRIQNAGQNPESEPMVDEDVVMANNQFTTTLFDGLDSASNIISPLSVSFALSLVHLGAMGETNNQLTHLLGYKYGLDDLKYLYKQFNSDIISMSNILIINKNIGINQEYVDMIKSLALVIRDSDAALIAQKINRYVEDKTNSMIKDVVSGKEVNAAIFTLINTIYFRGSWEHQFDPANTVKMKFHKTRAELVDMMHQINYYNYYENKYIQMVEMSYREKNYAMGIILPPVYHEETPLEYTINNVPRFSHSEINEFINNTQYRKVDLYIPRFTDRKKFYLVPILIKLGLIDIFTRKAELDIIAKDIYISDIVHEAMIVVDEIGSEAAAVKNVQADDDDDEKPVLFKADHAFVYYIRHVPTNIFLFYGDFTQ